MTHGQLAEAEAIVESIEQQVKQDKRLASLPEPEGNMALHTSVHATFMTVAQQLVKTYPKRTVLGVTLMVTPSTVRLG